MDNLIKEFLDYLKYERNRSGYTVENYGADLMAFHCYLEESYESLSWQDIDSDIIRSWMEFMMDAGNKATTINRRLSSLRTFYRFAVSREKLQRDPAYQVKGPKKGKPLPQYLREDEMDRLLSGEYWNESFRDLRSRTIILTFYSTGVRLAELVGLDDASIDFHQNQLKVLGKRNKERIIPFGQELKSALSDYINARKGVFGTTGSALFVTDKGIRMSPYQVRTDVIRNLSKVSTMKKRSPHVLRHTFATAMLNNDSGIESVKKLLGHESVTTTEIYTHTTFEQLRKVYGKAHPRGENDEILSVENDKDQNGQKC